MKTQEKISRRPPVVAILGHVDHGKTSLLDAIRKTNVQAREIGGITQKIGASIVRTDSGRDVVFIDTPGHAAFSKMRSCGVSASDIAVLVVAADDGVMPQTKESIEYIKEANTPFVIAITKIDLPSAKVDVVKMQLAKEGIMLESEGGDVPFVLVSSKTGRGIKDLLDLILLLWDLNKQVLGDDKLRAVVIETSLMKAGPSVSVVVKSGVLKLRQEVFAGNDKAKVRGLIDAHGKSVDKILAGYPALILGFEKFPPVGCLICDEVVSTSFIKTGSKDKLGLHFQKSGNQDKLNLILKAESQGSLEAVLSSVPGGVSIINFGVGEVTKNDVLLAKSTNSLIFTFGIKLRNETIKLSEAEGVKIENFDIIYRLIERIEEILLRGEEKILAKAQILAEFPFEGKKVAGCKVLFGEISKNDRLLLKRGEKVLGEVKVLSLKKQKKDVDKVSQGEEFGMLFVPQLDFNVQDVLVLTTPASNLDGK